MKEVREERKISSENWYQFYFGDRAWKVQLHWKIMELSMLQINHFSLYDLHLRIFPRFFSGTPWNSGHEFWYKIVKIKKVFCDRTVKMGAYWWDKIDPFLLSQCFLNRILTGWAWQMLGHSTPFRKQMITQHPERADSSALGGTGLVLQLQEGNIFFIKACTWKGKFCSLVPCMVGSKVLFLWETEFTLDTWYWWFFEMHLAYIESFLQLHQQEASLKTFISGNNYRHAKSIFIVSSIHIIKM